MQYGASHAPGCALKHWGKKRRGSDWFVADRVGELTGKPDQIAFHNVDVCDPAALARVAALGIKWSACIHFAAHKVLRT